MIKIQGLDGRWKTWYYHKFCWIGVYNQGNMVAPHDQNLKLCAFARNIIHTAIMQRQKYSKIENLCTATLLILSWQIPKSLWD